MKDLKQSYQTEIQIIEAAYEDLRAKLYGDNNPIGQVCDYVLASEGKKIRPLLCLLACQSYSEQVQHALPAAIALEFIHTYSLVHDDLPAMDDDDMRRGRPTAHVKYDEARAILAGDALLADAFRLLTEKELWPFELDPSCTLWQAQVLAKCAGSGGIVLGQALDLDCEQMSSLQIPLATLEKIHRFKTGELMGAALALGTIAAGQSTPLVEAYYGLGIELGLVFQLVDDLIDELPGTGKTRGKDKQAGKLTYLSYYDRTTCMRIAEEKTERLVQEIRKLEGSDQLIKLTQLLCRRVK